MWKLAAVSVVLAGLVSSSALGGILQGQDFAIGTANAVHLLQGEQGAGSAQDLIIDITQDTSGGGLAIVSAHVVGVSGEISSAWGVSGLLGANRLGLNPVLGGAGVLVPQATSAEALLARTRLNSLLLRAQ